MRLDEKMMLLKSSNLHSKEAPFLWITVVEMLSGLRFEGAESEVVLQCCVDG